MGVDDVRPPAGGRESAQKEPQLLAERALAPVRDDQVELVALALELLREAADEDTVVGVVRARVERGDEQDAHRAK